MKVIVGLGNPGREYAQTKHNVGFMLVDALASHLGVTEWREKFDALVADARIGTEKVLLVKPQTYMNESGKAVGPLMHFYKLPAEDLIVAHDDMDIPVGTIRIRKKGSSGGHNGIKSILAHFGDEHFARVRIGIGRPLPGWTVVNHVLAAFPEEDQPKIREAIDYLIPAVECIVTHDVDMAMNQFNPKKKKKAKKAQAAEASEGAAGAEGRAREEYHEQAE
ncbi:aminoacyl-tRNA hydrolase [Selenomonas sp.]|uniref:aminoacyl-tRNA hydrolase n=1 Tax=Selenomonas sp. TaxID=2053611 RepID=UPI002A750303|nr:aminoacyl-tRNA hydrolase [Selenomonas sp.]MDY3296460.1 aminoacyl-tRNA hydrolase [Selenomonas sp.]